MGEGAKTFALFSGPLIVPTVQDRLRGFTHVLARAGFKRCAEIMEGDFSVESDYKIFMREYGPNAWLLRGEKRKLPNAIVTHNDLMACGVIKAATELGLKVPEDFKLTGYDDIRWPRCSRPLLPLCALI